MTGRPTSLERALEEAVSRALRDNLAPLQRTADELHQAYADLVAACSSTRPSNALPAMLRAQTAASSLAAGLSVLSNFVAVALNSREHHGVDEAEESASSGGSTAVMKVGEESPAAAETIEALHQAPDHIEMPVEGVTEEAAFSEAPAAIPEEAVANADDESAVAESSVQQGSSHQEQVAEAEVAPGAPAESHEAIAASESDAPSDAPAEAEVAAAASSFEVASLPTELQDLHRRANRVAKVAMQDIQLLRPKDVRLGRENNDLCDRLRSDLDKARKEYDRRFRAIQDHPVDYFHRWMVEILAAGDEKALGEYPYPSPVLRH